MRILRHPFFRWTLTILLLILIGYQLWERSDQFQSLSQLSFGHTGWYIIVVIALMPVNWSLESLKWHQFLSVHTQVPLQKIFKSVTCGVALSLFTPNRIGEYGGRLLFMPYTIRWPVAISTMIGSVSQNLVAFILGMTSIIILFQEIALLKIVGLLSIAFAVFCFFKMKMVVSFICRMKLHPVLKKLARQLSYIEDYSIQILLRGLGLSLLRYLVYTTQFVVLLVAFEPDANVISLFLGVSSLYLFHTLIPLPPVADVLARTNVALILWSGTGMHELSISLASFIVWLVNLLIPAIIGSVILGTTSPGKSFNTHDQHLGPAYKPVIADQSAGA